MHFISTELEDYIEKNSENELPVMEALSGLEGITFKMSVIQFN